MFFFLLLGNPNPVKAGLKTMQGQIHRKNTAAETAARAVTSA
jgi:hypothetical protein